MMLTIPDHDRRIERLKRLLSIEKNARKRLVTIAELKRRHADPTFREKFRRRRLEKDRATGRMLPDMNAEQRARYDNAKQHYGVTRAEALAIAMPGVPDYRTNTIRSSAGSVSPALSGSALPHGERARLPQLPAMADAR